MQHSSICEMCYKPFLKDVNTRSIDDVLFCDDACFNHYLSIKHMEERKKKINKENIK